MRPYQCAVLLSTAMLAHAGAQAGEVTLFSGADLSGRETVVRGEMNDLVRAGFNDRTVSLVVHSGTWEMCVDSKFRGECRVFEPGTYRNLDRFTNQISSLREVESARGAERGRGRWREREREQGVTLFDSPDMRGRSVALRGDTNDFVPLGFNDMTQSMVIRGGSWEFCQHSDFRGQCRLFGPGEYRNLDRSFQRQISSARQVGGADDGRGYGQNDGYRRDDRRDERREDGYDQRGGYDPRGGADQRGNYDQRSGSAVELYTGQGFAGMRVPVNDEIRSLTQINLNDQVGSIVIQSGQWEFCQHAEFRGQCTVYGPGRYPRLGLMQNAISSVRRVR
jgi:hypothetical protein